MHLSRWVGVVALIVGIVLPLIIRNEYYRQILTLGYIWAIGACGLNVILGFTGQLSLAHAGFLGLGAYTVGLLTTDGGWTFWAALPVAIALTSVAGHAIGSLCLRSKGHYFAIFTLALGLIIHLVIQKWESLTHGHIGVIGIPGPTAIGPIDFSSSLARSYLVLTFLTLTVLATTRLLHSPVGRTLLAIRESEALAAAVGLDVMRSKRMAFTISAALAGLAGALYAGFIGYLGPEVAAVTITFDILLYVMVGGIGSVSGPVAGTFIVYGLSQVLGTLQEYQMVIFGPALVLLVMFLPGGLAGALRKLRGRHNLRDSAPTEGVA